MPSAATLSTDEFIYQAKLNDEVFQRIIIEQMKCYSEHNIKELEAHSTDDFTHVQMLRHRRALLTATKCPFVRDLPIWTGYLASSVGQKLEDARWRRYLDSDDKDLFTKESDKLVFGKSTLMKSVRS